MLLCGCWNLRANYRLWIGTSFILSNLTSLITSIWRVDMLGTENPHCQKWRHLSFKTRSHLSLLKLLDNAVRSGCRDLSAISVYCSKVDCMSQHICWYSKRGDVVLERKHIQLILCTSEQHKMQCSIVLIWRLSLCLWPTICHADDITRMLWTCAMA